MLLHDKILSVKKLFLVLLLLGLQFFVSNVFFPTQVSAQVAGCDASSNQASFFLDPEYTQRITSIEYEVTSTGNRRPLIDNVYVVFRCTQSSAATGGIEMAMLGVGDWSAIPTRPGTIGGEPVMVGTVDRDRLVSFFTRASASQISFRATKGGVAFSRTVSIPTTRLEAQCAMRVTACKSNAEEGKYELTFDLVWRNMDTGPGYTFRRNSVVCVPPFCNFPLFRLPSASGTAQYRWSTPQELPSGRHDFCFSPQIGEVVSCSRALCNGSTTVGAELPYCSSVPVFPDPLDGMPGEITKFDLCQQIPDADPDKSKCMQCEDERQGVWTAIGCVEASPQSIITTVITIGMGLAGGIAMLMILAAAFLFSTSQGDPKRTSQARDLVTSAVIGLIFIIFSVTILQFIGVNILRIPDFGI